MKNKPRNRKSLLALLVLLIFCAAYMACDAAAGVTPVLPLFVPTGVILLFCIYMVLKMLGVKRSVCYAVFAGLIAVMLLCIRSSAKEAHTTEASFVPITHLDFMCKDAGNGNIQLCSITCKEYCREVYVGVFKLPDGKVMVYFCKDKPVAPAALLTSCELNTGRSVFRVVVNADPQLTSLKTVNIADGTHNAFSKTSGQHQQLSPVFVQPAISPHQALQIASRELQMSPDTLAVYANDFCYSVEPRLPEDTLGGGETLDIDMNSGNILKRYFSE